MKSVSIFKLLLGCAGLGVVLGFVSTGISPLALHKLAENKCASLRMESGEVVHVDEGKEMWPLLSSAQRTVGQAAVLALALPLLLGSPLSSVADELKGEKLFNTQCIACHIKGTNFLASDKTLELASLQKNGKGDAASIGELVKKGNGLMPSFKLTDKEVEEVSEYVIAKAGVGW